MDTFDNCFIGYFPAGIQGSCRFFQAELSQPHTGTTSSSVESSHDSETSSSDISDEDIEIDHAAKHLLVEMCFDALLVTSMHFYS
jgi:hypothetical protein